MIGGFREFRERADRKSGILRQALSDRDRSGSLTGFSRPGSRREGGFAARFVYLKLANSWPILNVGGGPMLDKPEVILETPPNPNRQTAFLNLRVADIGACYKEWKSKGAEFLTEPLDSHGHESGAVT